VAQLAWILDHTRDLDADFRCFYRLTWAEAVRRESGPDLMALAYRCSAYQGVMRARLENLRAEQAEAQRRSTGGREVASVVPGTASALKASNLGDLFDME